MKLSEFDFALPPEQIAKFPATPRDHSRLLVVDKKTGKRTHQNFFDLPQHLRPGDLLVFNDTKVLPARLFGRDAQGREFEIFLLKAVSQDSLRWSCLVRPQKRVLDSVRLSFGKDSGTVFRSPQGSYEIEFSVKGDFLDWLFQHGTVPLPPYIKRATEPSDRDNYQTVYARKPGSVAAPTAGLHFTEELLSKLQKLSIEQAHLTLHVGYGTFSPIRTEDIESHSLHEESFHIPEQTMEKIQATRAGGGRVIAVGTTSLRALESVTEGNLSGNTQLYIRPGHTFQRVDGLITNFHLPKSSLYILVASFLGLDCTRASYADAITAGYRFFSYGDAMAVLP